MNEKYSVYVKTSEEGYITAIHSDAFLSNLTGWLKIDEGYGDKFHHAQGNYFLRSIVNNDGCYCYKLIGGIVQEVSEEELAEQRAKLQPDIQEMNVWDEMAAAYSEGVQSA